MHVSVFPEALLNLSRLKHFTVTLLGEEQFEKTSELLLRAINLEELEVA